MTSLEPRKHNLEDSRTLRNIKSLHTNIRR